jgi:hypothetical protein
VADSDWDNGGRDGRSDTRSGKAGVFQAAGGFAVQQQKLASIFSDSKLRNNLDCADVDSVAYQLFPPLINLSKLVSLFIEFSFLVGKFSLLNHRADALQIDIPRLASTRC